LASAIWHGFYPGFYIAFITAGFFREVAIQLRRVLRPFFVNEDGSPKPTKPLYDVLTNVFTIVALDYNFCVFVVYDVTGPESSFRLLGSVYYCGHIIAAVILILLLLLSGKKKKDKSK